MPPALARPERNRLRHRQLADISASQPRAPMLFLPVRIIVALSLLAFALSACARERAGPATCQIHKTGNGDLTECD
ncbi:hypothetical protein BOSE127_80135 [Bosea sp. 127]|nr:hypothetical protein BOSE127_80135 [Bosea sp. 127]